MDIAQLIAEFGFPVVMVVGLGYFVYFVWQTITNTIDPDIQEMNGTIIRLTDQLRLLDQDMIRLQQKVNTVLQVKEQETQNDYSKETKQTKQSGTKTQEKRGRKNSNS